MKKVLFSVLLILPFSITASPIVENIGDPIEAGLALLIAAGTVFGINSLKKKEI